MVCVRAPIELSTYPTESELRNSGHRTLRVLSASRRLFAMNFDALYRLNAAHTTCIFVRQLNGKLFRFHRRPVKKLQNGAQTRDSMRKRASNTDATRLLNASIKVISAQRAQRFRPAQQHEQQQQTTKCLFHPRKVSDED